MSEHPRTISTTREAKIREAVRLIESFRNPGQSLAVSFLKEILTELDAWRDAFSNLRENYDDLSKQLVDLTSDKVRGLSNPTRIDHT